jgi:hypothetical protein
MKQEEHITRLQRYLVDNAGFKIQVDGLIGPETRTATTRFLYEQFDRRGWEKAVLSNRAELVWLRYDMSYNNKFNDFCVLINNGKVSMVFPATTTPGDYWIYNPVTVGGITGCACLCEQQVIGSHRWVENNDWSTLWLGMPYAKQIGLLKIYRDGNKDHIFDRNLIVDAPNNGINFHQMGAGTINWNWSGGCLGTSKANWYYIVDCFDNGNILNLNLLEL